ncbi:MAG: Os1348 family NHLP clan protein [Ktedonobacteraceae bacterium]
MSWQIVNQILGLAAVDKEFAQALLKEPVAAVQARGFSLTPTEQEVFSEICASNLNELSQHLMRRLRHDDLK